MKNTIKTVLISIITITILSIGGCAAMGIIGKGLGLMGSSSSKTGGVHVKSDANQFGGRRTNNTDISATKKTQNATTISGNQVAGDNNRSDIKGEVVEVNNHKIANWLVIIIIVLIALGVITPPLAIYCYLTDAPLWIQRKRNRKLLAIQKLYDFKKK